MTTTPPEEPQTPPPASTGTTGTSGTDPGMAWFGSGTADARMPIPGNAEFLLYVVALLLAALVCWIADELGSSAWLSFFQWTTIAYVLSRGIAKASRVLEH